MGDKTSSQTDGRHSDYSTSTNGAELDASEPNRPPQALANLRVLDLSRVLAGPWCTQILADLGADVIKVERPETGDDARSYVPRLGPLDDESATESSYFLCANRGKRSITADLSTEQGRDKVRELAREADVLVENFKVGTLARYGLDYATLTELNPRLIYCSITGFGQTGPYRHRAAYDTSIQAMGGLMSITGLPDDQAGAGPQKVGVPIVDIMTGVYASTGILAALTARAATGRGQQVDIALLDVSVAGLCYLLSNYLITSQLPLRAGNAHVNSAPSDLYKCRDGYLLMNIGNDIQFQRLCAVAGLEALGKDPRFATNTLRLRNRKALEGSVHARFRQETMGHWMKLLSEAGVPIGPVNTIAEMLADPQVKDRGLVVDVPHPVLGTTPAIANPIRLSDTPVRYRPVPRLGEHEADGGWKTAPRPGGDNTAPDGTHP